MSAKILERLPRISRPRFEQGVRCIARPVRTTRSRLSTAASPTSSVNEEEIKFFSRLASQWWDESGEFGLLHRMNPVRVRFIRNKLLEVARDDGLDAEENAEESAKVLNGLEVLDIGCGGGLLSESLARLGARTVGIDASSQNIAIASLHASQDPTLRSSALDYRNSSAEELVNETRRFDIVCSMEVLEHVDNPAVFLQSCAELVKPGGHLFLSTISRTPLAYLLTIFAAEKMLGLVQPGTHTYDKYVKPAELIDFFRKPVGDAGRPWIADLYGGIPPRNEAEVRGIAYLPWKGAWELAPRGAFGSTECNYLFWARKPVS
ncbi:3-demethylubiquinone-9 3-methyltransferase [Fomitiporia mediterranea MF3/22]|uniref:3-demethylubiquinone-9 3-methyltransferase n=1 Tax=Fomitiporia mediterranea (strain MF3/22) TaxID=694068 RepID=UPI000440754F|nr:3-demethylubiquinone-9 3-methyltransferase [Fomitiporia mediterranea MF3/22]EJC98235.1 3-demethylubiquinone-9 3-methyltransferase [Fomitiporia mediterranea MF3/22]